MNPALLIMFAICCILFIWAVHVVSWRMTYAMQYHSDTMNRVSTSISEVAKAMKNQ